MPLMRFLITAGPTREAIDPVRYLTNHSSGKMGYCLAEAAVHEGHSVLLISGPTSLDIPHGVDFLPVECAQEMYDAVKNQAPYADAMAAAGILGFPLALLAAGIAFGGDFSTLNASTATTSRYLFTMARDGVMPAVFAKTSKRFQTPYVAVIALGILTLALIATDSLIYIASLSLFADLFYYVIGIVAAWALRRKCPGLERPYRAPWLMIGAPVSAVIYLYMMTQLDTNAFVTGIIWSVLGLVIYFVCRKTLGTAPVMSPSPEETGAAELPATESEKRAMDREYRLWQVIVGAVMISLALYALPWLMR